MSSLIKNQRKAPSAASFMEKSLTTLSIGSRVHTDVDDDRHGPLGLTLLFSPPEPLIDFIFVHGLRGGSYKTWTFADDPHTFWPRSWLPEEPRFRNVRIHSFGYSADWGSKKESQLSVHDFGQALLSELLNSPEISAHEQQTAIVLIGHSMGGIVIKKAVLLAKQDPNCNELWTRFHSMFFLATPHRGADGANLLKKLLLLTSKEAYVDDIRPGSISCQVINDEFRNAYGGIHLYSFFETIPMSHIGIVVDRESAILGLPKERVHLLNADHRHVCKFAVKSDSNYCSLRNAFITAIEAIEKSWLPGRRNAHLSQMQHLSQYLDVAERPDAELERVTQRQTDGTCLWLDRHQDFQTWLHRVSSERVFLLEGEPATGKSTVAGHVIRSLENSGEQCAFFFFKHGDATKSTAAMLLRSFAWQMAATNAECRLELQNMAEQHHFFDKNDEGSVWRNVFIARILKCSWQQPFYWIIDALDECVNYATLFPFFAKIEDHHPLRILITGRPLLAIDRLFSHEKIPRMHVVMSITDSLEDIKLFLKANADFLPAEDEKERDMLLRRILNRSNGNFLWTSLVLQELADTPSVQQAYQVLDSVPNGMDDLYSRILDALMTNHRARDIAKAVLRWVVCATRPMTVEELKGALELDIHTTLPRLEQTLGSITGNLVGVSSNSVQLVHQTVRAFLMREHAPTETLKYFGIIRARDHMLVSKVCLAYLSGADFKSPRVRRASLSTRREKRSPFATYAIAHFSDHLTRASLEDAELLSEIQTFLNTNSLSWIELIATSGDLQTVVRTAANLRSYLQRRAQLLAPLGEPVEDVTAWSNDLGRLVASFGKPILMSPTSVHFLIPSVCPQNSIVSRKFASYPRALRFAGRSDSEWDDRVSCIVFASTQAFSVASHDDLFAVGLSDGTARVISLSTTQERRTFNHQEQVRLIRFSASDQHLITASRKMICVWDRFSGSQRWEQRVDNPLLCVEFFADGTSVIAITNGNTVLIWCVSTGELTQRFDICDIDETTGQRHPQNRVATHAQFSPNLNMLAVAYRQRPVVIWEFMDDSCEYVFSYTKDATTYPGPLLFTLTFNPRPELALLAAAYDDGDLVVLDLDTQRERASIREPVAKMCGSNDGLTLAVGNGSGRVSLFAFETLQRLYCIDSYEVAVRDFAFSSNSQCLLEVRGNHCNIWQPPILSQSVSISDVASGSLDEPRSVAATMVALKTYDDEKMITGVFAPYNADLVFCGHEDGLITVHTTMNGAAVMEITGHHKNVPVCLLGATPTGQFLASLDVSGRLLVHEVMTEGGRFATMADQKGFEVILQVVFNHDGSKILISIEDGAEVRKVPSMEVLGTFTRKNVATGKWAQHPLKPECLLFVSPLSVDVYKWADLSRLSSQLASNSPSVETAQPVNTMYTASRCQRFCVLRSSVNVDLLGPKLEIYDSRALQLDKPMIQPLATYEDLAKDVKVLIGLHESSLVFLTHQGWICSLDLTGPPKQQSYTRHFFIPFKYHNSGGVVQLTINAKGVISLVFNSDVLIFEHGFEFAEKIKLGTVGALPGTTSTKLSMKSVLQRGHSAPVYQV